MLKELEDVIIKVIKEEWPKLRQQAQGEARNLEKAPEDFDIDLADYFDLIAGQRPLQMEQAYAADMHVAKHSIAAVMSTNCTLECADVCTLLDCTVLPAHLACPAGSQGYRQKQHYVFLAIALTWGLPRCAGTSAGSILATYLATKGEYLSPTLLPPGIRKGRHLQIHSETCGTSHRSGVGQAEELSDLQASGKDGRCYLAFRLSPGSPIS